MKNKATLNQPTKIKTSQIFIQTNKQKMVLPQQTRDTKFIKPKDNLVVCGGHTTIISVRAANKGLVKTSSIAAIAPSYDHRSTKSAKNIANVLTIPTVTFKFPLR